MTTVIEREQERPMRPFLILWSGQAISLLGSQLVQFALIWWLTQETGSATVLALASLAGLVPAVVLGPFAGVFVDRWNRRVTMLLADSAITVATLLLAYLFYLGEVQTWQVLALLFMRSLAGTFHFAAMSASTSLMVPDRHLTRVQGLNQMLNGGMNIVAAPLGALLLSLLPIQGVLAVDVATALIAILALLVVAVPQPPQAQGSEMQGTRSTYREDFVAGLRYVRGWPAMMIMIGMAMLINLVLNPAFALIPLLVRDHFGGSAWHLGILEALFGAGVIAGGLLLGTWGGFRRRILTSLTGLVLMGFSVLALGLVPAGLFGLALLAAIMIGAMSTLTNGPVMAIFQSVVSPEMQGRVLTLLGSLAGAMAPLGLILAGPLADLIGVRSWFILGGTTTIIAGTIGFFIPALLEIEERAKAGDQVVSPTAAAQTMGP
jgi:DHA3 family macrolide efflux protein-like MFS transporter